jgi:hypothetical protein
MSLTSRLVFWVRWSGALLVSLAVVVGLDPRCAFARNDVPTGARGVAADPEGHALYISYGGDGGPAGPGRLLNLDLLSGDIVWSVGYSHGIDSMTVTPDGKTIYMPDYAV